VTPADGGGGPDDAQGPDEPEAAELLPPKGTSVRLEWDDRTVGLVAVRAVDDVTVLCRADGGPVQLPLEGTELDLGWADDLGLVRASGVIARVRYELITVQLVGEPVRAQRRRFYRAPVALDVEIVQGRRVTKARTRDLSEAGARLAVEGGGMLPPTKVTTRVNLDARQLAIPATVVRCDPTGDGAELGLAFGDVDVPAADAIRREVLNAQLTARRMDKR
jgi:hypothetical protein